MLLMFILSSLFGYILGSIPFGLILTKVITGTDVRNLGSGNIGATNVLRTGSKKIALATLLLDAFKGTVAVLIVMKFNYNASIFAGFFAFLGHLFPIWLNFKGGKGVATYFGILLAFAPFISFLFALGWVVTLVISRYSSLAALLATFFTPITFLLEGKLLLGIMFSLLTILVYMRHSKNIVRLVSGEEPKVFKSKS